MPRHTLTLMVLVAMLCPQIGCWDLGRRDSAPHSQRTEQAYAANPFEPAPIDPTVRRYTEQLQHLLQPEEPADAPLQAQPVRVPPVPLLPIDGPAPSAAHPLSPRAQRRTPDWPTDQPAYPEPPTPPAESPLPTPPTPPSTHAEPAPQSSLEDVIAYYELLAAEQPDDLQLQLRLRMMYLAARQDQKALLPLTGADQAQASAIRSILQSMIAIRDNSQGSVTPEDAATALIALESLRDRLMGFADLQVPVIKLCRAVDGYGVYRAFETNEFMAGRSQPVIVYLELRNYAADADATGLYQTQMNVSLVLFDSFGQAVQTQSDKNIQDISANRRSDFFLTRVVILPASLSPGDYTLKVTVEDIRANKVASSSVPVTIVSPTGS